MDAIKTAALVVVLLTLMLAFGGALYQQGQTDADEPSVEAGGSTLTSLYIPEETASISAGAFIGCEKLRFVTIPSTVTSIGAGAFSGCPSLVSLTFIGESSVSIEGDSQIFDDPYKVTIINATGEDLTLSADLVGGKGISKAEPGAAMVYSSGGWYEAYMFTFDDDAVSKVTWKGTYRGTLVMPSNVSVICNGANNQMFGFDKDWIDSVVIPDGVTTIGNNAFSGCSWIKTAPLPSTVTTIGNNAFANCSSIKTMELPSGLRTLGWNAFANCTGLTEMSVPDGTSEIYGAFQGCKNLKTVSLPHNISSIGDFAFFDCNALTEVELTESIETIGTYAFYGCSTLKSVVIPTTVKSIGDRGFEGCTSLTAVQVSEGIESIGTRAFARCTSLTSMTVPASVDEIGYEAFSSCSSLGSIDIQKRASLTIGEYAFPINAAISMDFYSEAGTLLVSNYYKHGTFEYKTLDKPGFHRTSI